MFRGPLCTSTAPPAKVPPNRVGSSRGSPMAAKRTFREALLSYAHPRVATMLVLGAACGLPLLTISNTLGLWLTDSNVTMTSIGLFAYTLLPYSFKFAWAPILDQVKLPI